MITVFASASDLGVVGSAGNWRFDHGVDHWAIRELESDATVVPIPAQTGSRLVYFTFSTSAFLNQRFTLSKPAAAIFLPEDFVSAIVGQRNTWFLNPISETDYESQIHGQGRTHSDSEIQSTLGHKIAIRELMEDYQRFDVEQPIDLRSKLEEVFSLARGEHFEDGIETSFSRAIGEFVRRHKLGAIDVIRRATEHNLYRDTYVAEALLWIGELDDDETESARRILLEEACGSPSLSIRDAAVSGLSYLGAAGSKEQLERMLDVEHVKGIRANIHAVLAYLRG